MAKTHDYEFIDENGIHNIIVMITEYVLNKINELNGSGIYGGGSNKYDSTAAKDTLRDVNGNDFYPYTTSDAVYHGLTNLSAIIENFNQELDSKAASTAVPTKLSELENDKTYQTLQEINTLITNALPTKLSQLNNDNNYQTLTQVNNLIQSAKLINVSELINDRNYQTDTEVLNTVTLKISEVVAGADTDFDTLKEISDWIKTHADSASAMNTQIQQNKTDITTLNANFNNYSLKNHTHNYAGSVSAGGSANSAVKLDTATAGSATQPVYFTGGKPVACTYTLGKSVPSDAAFTDTHYTSHLYVGASGGNANATSTTSNPYLLCVDNTTNRNSIQLKAGTNMSISAINGVITFTNSYSLPTSSSNTLGGVKIGANINISSGIISINNASTSQKGVVQLTSDLTGASETLAATQKAVNMLNSNLITGGIYSPVNSFGCYTTFSNNAWGSCVSIIWIPHSTNLTFSLIEVMALGDGNLSVNVTSKCTLDSSRTQYFKITCTDTSVAHKLASIIFKVTN